MLLSREEWLKRTGKSSGSGTDSKGGRGYRDRSKVRCFNCNVFGHYQSECRKGKRDQRNEANLTQIEGDEPTLLLEKCDDNKDKMILLNEKGVTPNLSTNVNEKVSNSSIWYLDNGASNHKTGL